MDNQAKLQVYQAQVMNVRSLATAMRQAHRSINEALRRSDSPRVEAFTKMYALLFCAWAEANFSKVLHTPHGFDADEIAQIQGAKLNGVTSAWKKCVELGLRHIDAKRGDFKPNARQKLEQVIDAHVFDPSLLRNKLAHGQWTVALNRSNDAVMAKTTTDIAALNITRIEGWLRGHELLAGVVESLMESPKKAFLRDWYQFVVDIEAQMLKAEARTLDQHVARLRKKDADTGAHAKRRGKPDVGKDEQK